MRKSVAAPRGWWSNAVVYPEVRSYADPYEGLAVQLTELRGLVKTVPPLIEADRERRWEEIGSRPGDPDDDMIDIYEREAGPEEGYGHAQYDRTILAAAVVMAWDVFREYLCLQLKACALRYNLTKFPALARLVDEETRSWDRRFDKIEQRFREFAEIPVASWPSWRHVRHAHELRNALVHNLGMPTAAYLKLRPDVATTEPIDLSVESVDDIIGHLLEVALEVQTAATT